jgi:VanZ family protein
MTEPEDHGRPRASPVARAALLAYLLLIVYASWFPFSGWRSTGLPPLAFLNLQPQRYWTGFDVMVNVVGYMPLGGLLVLSLYPRVRGVWAVLVAALGGVLVSGIDGNRAELPAQPRALEPRPVHQFGRRLAGAIVAALFAHALLDQSRLYQLRRRWFASARQPGPGAGGLVAAGPGLSAGLPVRQRPGAAAAVGMAVRLARQRHRPGDHAARRRDERSSSTGCPKPSSPPAA